MGKRSVVAEVNSEILKWGRETLGLDLEEAAHKIKVKSEQLDAWEKGESFPSFSQLKKLANLYKRAAATFFLPLPPREPSLPTDFRVTSGEKPKQLSPKSIVAIRRARQKREQAVELAQALEIEPQQFTHHATDKESPEDVATRVIKLLGADHKFIKDLGSEAFGYWKQKIESLGVFVFQASVPTIEEFRGLSIFEPIYPVILLNTKDSTNARTFSLLHELCHLLLNNSGICNLEVPTQRGSQFNKIEVFCNAVAGEVLVPKAELLNEPEVKNVTGSEWAFHTLALLGKRYKVSWEVILRRLLSFDLTTKDHYEKQRADYIKRLKENKKKDQLVIIPPYRKALSHNGFPFTTLVLDSFHSKKIDASSVSDLLGLKLEHLSKVEAAIYKKDLE